MQQEWDLDSESIAVWPCLHEERIGEWILRFGGGLYGRSNSVQPFGSPGTTRSEAIDHCIASYHRAGLPPMFRIPRIGTEWQYLESDLLERGFRQGGKAGDVMVSSDLAWKAHPGVTRTEDPSHGWLRAYLQGSDRALAHLEAAEELYRRVPRPRRFAELARNGSLASVGMATIHRNTAWLFGITTLPHARRQGGARAICEDLLGWARTAGATRAALQVSPDNEGARRLYEQLGFQHVYSYHYVVLSDR